MNEFEGFGGEAEQNAAEIEQRKLKAVKKKGRAAAIELGRLLGERTALERGETGSDREQRVARAMAYAAWEVDGKPEGGAHLEEFSVPAAGKTVAAASGPDLKPEKKTLGRRW